MIHHSAQRLRKRQVLTRVYAGAVIAWSVIRTVIIWAALGDYGFNPWIYLGIDLVCSAVDAITTPRMVLRFVDDRYRSAIKWGMVSLVAYVVPDVYIFLGTRTLPKKVIVVLCLVIIAMLGLTVVTIVHKIRKGREERALLEAALELQGHA
jgi:hypothetical protein